MADERASTRASERAGASTGGILRNIRLPRGGPYPVESLEQSHERVRASFAGYARNVRRWRRARTAYMRDLIRRYCFYVEPRASVLEVGVGTGDLLAALGAERAVGVDICPEMLAIARSSHPQLELYEMAAEDLGELEGPFDYIVLSDLTVYVYDIVAVLRGLRRLCHERTRLILNFHSRLWQPVFTLLGAVRLQHAHHRTNWITTEDLENLLELADFEVLRRDVSTLLPAPVPVLGRLANDYLFRLGRVQDACLVNWLVARPRWRRVDPESLSVSVVVPARNESGNIRSIIDRTPAMGKRTELIFVEGNSTDDTWPRILSELAESPRPDLDLRAFRQTGTGKGDAVRLGFAQAKNDVLMILDADLTVPPEELPALLDAIAGGKAELVNGSRLVYPLHDGAMRFLNVVGNKAFARIFSYLLGQNLKDTLCGTKVLTAADYARIARGRGYFGDFDPFGDFDLLFGASKLGLKIVEVPVRYRGRVYGETNISRFRDGWLLLRMSWFALRRLKLGT